MERASRALDGMPHWARTAGSLTAVGNRVASSGRGDIEIYSFDYDYVGAPPPVPDDRRRRVWADAGLRMASVGFRCVGSDEHRVADPWRPTSLWSAPRTEPDEREHDEIFREIRDEVLYAPAGLVEAIRDGQELFTRLCGETWANDAIRIAAVTEARVRLTGLRAARINILARTYTHLRESADHLAGQGSWVRAFHYLVFAEAVASTA